MKKILLSIKPFWFAKIKSGKKKYEYRKRFCNEGVLAYVYVSRPIMAISGVLILGKRISLKELIDLNYEDKDIVKRVVGYVDRARYALPILEYWDTSELSLKEIQNIFPKFKAPQMYYNLAEDSNLLRFIESNIVIKGDKVINTFSKDDICS